MPEGSTSLLPLKQIVQLKKLCLLYLEVHMLSLLQLSSHAAGHICGTLCSNTFSQVSRLTDLTHWLLCTSSVYQPISTSIPALRHVLIFQSLEQLEIRICATVLRPAIRHLKAVPWVTGDPGPKYSGGIMQIQPFARALMNFNLYETQIVMHGFPKAIVCTHYSSIFTTNIPVTERFEVLHDINPPWCCFWQRLCSARQPEKFRFVKPPNISQWSRPNKSAMEEAHVHYPGPSCF